VLCDSGGGDVFVVGPDNVDESSSLADDWLGTFIQCVVVVTYCCGIVWSSSLVVMGVVVVIVIVVVPIPPSTGSFRLVVIVIVVDVVTVGSNDAAELRGVSISTFLCPSGHDNDGFRPLRSPHHDDCASHLLLQQRFS
jgi:hypothetical protein